LGTSDDGVDVRTEALTHALDLYARQRLTLACVSLVLFASLYGVAAMSTDLVGVAGVGVGAAALLAVFDFSLYRVTRDIAVSWSPFAEGASDSSREPKYGAYPLLYAVNFLMFAVLALVATGQ
jgi:hypothetical protein